MSSASAPVPGSRAIVGSALRSAGLIDRDTTMRDASDNPGGRKGKTRSGRTSHRISEYTMDRTPGSRSTHPVRLSASAHAGPSDPLSIRGASRPTMAGRIRRNAVSGGTAVSTSGSRIPRPSKTGAVDSWKEYVTSRWNPETQYLNLDSMIDDPIVKKHNLSPPGHGGTARDMAVIAKLASQLTPPVTTLSLANNNLTGLLLSQLPRYLPGLVNLSLSNNNFRDKRDLNTMVPRPEKFPNLRELVLIGNPLREAAVTGGLASTYRMDVLRRIPSLEVLDGEAIAKISFDAPQGGDSNVTVEAPRAKSFPFEMGPSFVTGVDSETMGGFLVRFFQAFDSDRNSLAAVYDPAATFSYSANTSIPARARVAGFLHTMPNQKKLAWTPWIENGSRNLSRVLNDPVKMMADLHVGPDDIVKTFKVLPKTHHDITGPAEKFSLDAFPVPHGTSTGLLIIVHGQFTEADIGGIRSFDRTFMVVPAPEGSRARLSGWSIMILSDQWTVRAYSSADAWSPGPLLLNHPPKDNFSIKSYPPDQQTALNSLPEAQRALVIQLSAQTKLTANFAVDCLQGNGWDLKQAVENFNQVKNSLGPEAFLVL